MSNQKPGEIVDVKTVKVTDLPGRGEPKIVGAKAVSETTPETLDSRSPATKQEVEVTQHLEKVTVKEHVRSKPQAKDEPEVRVREMDKEAQRQWQKVRRAEEE